MKTSVKVSIVAVIVLTIFLCLGNVAGACSSFGDAEYIVVFHPGITWKEAASEAASWGKSFELAAITSREEQRYVESLLGGLRGEFWIGGYEDTSRKWQWTSGEAWGYTHWAKGEPDRFSQNGRDHKWDRKHARRAEDHQTDEQNISGIGHYLAMGSNAGKNRLMWYDEQNGKNMKGFILERHVGGTTPVPIPPAALLLGSGMAMIGGFRLRGRRKPE